MLDRGKENDKIGRVAVNFGEYVAGDLYYPKSAKGPLPVVIWLHPYSYNLGYSGAYMVGPQIQQFLSQKGVAVLAFDQLGFGSRLHEATRFYERHPRWSAFGEDGARRASGSGSAGLGGVNPTGCDGPKIVSRTCHRLTRNASTCWAIP